jgi:MFS family permease
MIKKRKIFYGWWIALASIILFFISGGTWLYGFTVFFNPIRNAFGWTAAVTSVAFVLQRLEGGITGPIVGFLVDRLGPRKLMVAGWVVVGIGFILMSRINTLWAFYGSFLLIGIGMSFSSWVTINTTVANWFVKKRSRAMTLIYIGFGASGILAPFLALSVGHFGWRTTLVIVGIFLWVVGIPLSLVMRHRPSQYGLLPDGAQSLEQTEKAELGPAREITSANSSTTVRDFTIKETLRSRAFWLFSMANLFQQITTSALFVHIVPFLESVRFPTTTAAMVVTGITLCSLIGRLSFGFVGDFFSKRYLLTIALALQTIGLFVFAFIEMEKAWLVIPFLLIYAVGYGGTMPVRPALQADYFGARNFGTIMGLMATIAMTGGLASPVIAGWIFDITGSYHVAWLLFAWISVPAIPLMFLAKPPRLKPEPQVTLRGSPAI